MHPGERTPAVAFAAFGGSTAMASEGRRARAPGSARADAVFRPFGPIYSRCPYTSTLASSTSFVLDSLKGQSSVPFVRGEYSTRHLLHQRVTFSYDSPDLCVSIQHSRGDSSGPTRETPANRQKLSSGGRASGSLTPILAAGGCRVAWRHLGESRGLIPLPRLASGGARER